MQPQARSRRHAGTEEARSHHSQRMRCAAERCWLVVVLSALACQPHAVLAVPSVPTGPSAEALRLQAELADAKPGDRIVVPPGEIVFSNTTLLVQGAVSIRRARLARGLSPVCNIS